jgi:alpha-tubulin suppressor-like RCC1 family protein
MSISASLAGYHTCAVTAVGGVDCWGNNAQGQLGNNSTTLSSTPVQVEGPGGSGFLTGAVAASAGYQHSCALTAPGAVYCWGANGQGQLGTSSTTASYVPVQVDGPGGSGYLSGIAAVSAGYEHTCALTAAGGVYCWGANFDGQLGTNSTTASLVPVQVVGLGGSGYLSGITAVSVGYQHTCALTTAGGVYCWGSNGSGQLGTTATAQSNAPIQVMAPGGSGYLSGITAISAGSYHTCGLTTAGAVYCWGDNTDGDLGNGSTTASSLPVQVDAVLGSSGFLTGMTSIAAGGYHTCALTVTDLVDCWGYNALGQLGWGTSNWSVPVQASVL